MNDTSTNSAKTGSTAPVWFRLGPFDVTARRLGLSLVVITALGLVAAFWQRLDIAALHTHAQAMPALVVITAVSVLPLVGFPVSWLHLIAGVRFGFGGGILVVAGTTMVQQLLGWIIVRLAPARWFARLDPWRARLAGAGERDATILCCLLPGMPYSVQLYLLPILHVRLHLLLGLSAAIHTGRAAITILLGDMSDQLTPTRVAILTTYYIALIGTSTWFLRLLQRRLTPPS